MAAPAVSAVVALLVVLLDQGTKAVVVDRCPEGGAPAPGWSTVAIRRVTNRRGALLAGPLVMATVLLAAVASGGTTALLVADAATWAFVASALAVGGAVGNLVDRWARGGVVDFLVIGRWPAFNLADVALVAGLAVAAVGTLGSVA